MDSARPPSSSPSAPACGLKNEAQPEEATVGSAQAGQTLGAKDLVSAPSRPSARSCDAPQAPQDVTPDEPEGLDLAARLALELEQELEQALVSSPSTEAGDAVPEAIAPEDTGLCWRPKAKWSRRRAESGRSARYQDILADAMVRSEQVSPELAERGAPRLPVAMSMLEQGQLRPPNGGGSDSASSSASDLASCLRTGEILSTGKDKSPETAPVPTRLRFEARAPLRMAPVPESIQLACQPPAPPPVPAAALRPYRAPVIPVATQASPSLWNRIAQWLFSWARGA